MDILARAERDTARRHEQLPDTAASYVRELVISGQIRAGEFLRLEPIAEAIGTSVTPVREGLRLLENEGFVRLVPRRGFVVESFSPQDILDIFWGQAKLAGELAARAAAVITPERLAELEEISNQYDRALDDKDPDRMADLGHHFHARINSAAGSRRLAQMLGIVTNQLPRRFYATIEGQGDDTREEHPRILDCLRRGAAEEARAIMEHHILAGADHLIAGLRQRGLWSDAPGE